LVPTDFALLFGLTSESTGRTFSELKRADQMRPTSSRPYHSPPASEGQIVAQIPITYSIWTPKRASYGSDKMLSRRAALQGGSAAMAIAAPLAVLPLRTKAEDGEVFGLVEEWRCELEFEQAALRPGLFLSR